MSDFDQYQKDFAGSLKKKVQHWRDHKELVNGALDLAKQWSSVSGRYSSATEIGDDAGRLCGVTYAEGIGTINCVSLDLYLGQNDSISKDVQLFIEQYIEPFLEKHDLKYDHDSTNDYLKWKSFNYKNGNKEFMVRAWFAKSTKCKLIPTGEVKEIMEVVCTA